MSRYSAEERERIKAESRRLLEQADAEPPVYLLDRCEDPMEKWCREAKESEQKRQRATDLRHQRERQIVQQKQNAWLSAALEADWEIVPTSSRRSLPRSANATVRRSRMPSMPSVPS